jgi:hypothetical protein
MLIYDNVTDEKSTFTGFKASKTLLLFWVEI